MHRLIVALMLGLAPAMAQGAESENSHRRRHEGGGARTRAAFEKETGHKAVVDNDTAGGLARRIEGGEAFDLAVITPGVINDLAGKGKIVGGTRVNVARVGVGVVVKEGAPAPDVSNVEAFKSALIAAKTVAYIDPASGGSSGIYLTGLFDKLGIAAEIKPKAKLKQGGYVADLIASGEAELGLHQISEILPVKGVKLVGPLAGGNPELHHLCGRGRQGRQAARCRARDDQAARRPVGRQRAQGARHGAAAVVNRLVTSAD